MLRGGTSDEYTLSLRTGAQLLRALPEEEYDVRDILIDAQGVWHSRGLPLPPARALTGVDAVLNGLHGGIGEDGTLARLLRQLSVAHATASAHASALSLHKARASAVMREAGIHVPRGVLFSVSNEVPSTTMARAVFEQFGPPYIVKPTSTGASHGVVYVASYPELPEAIARVLETYGAALVEEYIIGEETTAAVMDDFRGEELYAFPPARVVRPERARHLAHTHHLDGAIRYNTPSDFSHAEKEAIVEAARKAHRALGLSFVSRADIILSRRGPYVLEVNAVPGLYEGAALPPMLESVGSSVGEYARHQLQLARERN